MRYTNYKNNAADQWYRYSQGRLNCLVHNGFDSTKYFLFSLRKLQEFDAKREYEELSDLYLQMAKTKAHVEIRKMLKDHRNHLYILTFTILFFNNPSYFSVSSFGLVFDTVRKLKVGF